MGSRPAWPLWQCRRLRVARSLAHPHGPARRRALVRTGMPARHCPGCLEAPGRRPVAAPATLLAGSPAGEPATRPAAQALLADQLSLGSHPLRWPHALCAVLDAGRHGRWARPLLPRGASCCRIRVLRQLLSVAPAPPRDRALPAGRRPHRRKRVRMDATHARRAFPRARRVVGLAMLDASRPGAALRAG